MKFTSFLKDKLISMILMTFGILTIQIFLYIYPFGTFIKIYIPFVIFFCYLIGITIEFFTKKQYYNNLNNKLEELDQKYLLIELIKTPNFIEGKILHDVLRQTNKSMLEYVNYYKNKQEEYKEYIELWIHEVKIPIATSKLMIENNKNEITKNIDEELDKIEDYTKQALFYARSNTVEKDYMIKKVNLKDIIYEVIKKNRRQLLSSNIKIEIENQDIEVYTDSKWVSFILDQIIANSIKYAKKENAKIHICSKQLKDGIVLLIQDNGIGIKKNEITRVFEKGFTGINGRIIGKKSTGIGLYLCKKLCDKLSLGIELDSSPEEGTEVKIIFPKGSYTNL